MWRNLKIGGKLLLGFGLVLIAFLIAILIAWKDINDVRSDSNFLATAVVPAMVKTTSLERDLYAFSLQVMRMRFEGSEQSVADVKTGQAKIQKLLDEIFGFSAAHPNIEAMRLVTEKVLPLADNYLKMLKKAISASAKKNALYSIMQNSGESMYALINDALNALYTETREELQARNADKAASLLDLSHACAQTMDKIQNLRRDIQVATATADIQSINTSIDTIKSITKNIQTLQLAARSPNRQKMLDQLSASAQNYQDSLQVYITAYTELMELNRARAPLMDTMYSEMMQTTGAARKLVQDISSASANSLSACLMVLLSSACVAVIIGMLAAILISRSISKPLDTIVRLARRAGDGDLTIEKQDFQYKGKDELGGLVDAIINMIATQETSMHQVVAVADSLSHSAKNLSTISQETNASMEEVKASIDQVSSLGENNGAALEECNAGVGEMSAGANTVAQSATDSAAFIAQTTDASNKAIQTVDNVIVSMRHVDDNSKEREKKTRQLVESVENVSSFVSVITRIADQTNLLALNAAIEAARVGEMGRGFAVVAEEVRKLAEESARAAQNVNNIIVELQSSAQESIQATTATGRMLVETLVQAEQAQTELNGALKEMNKANDSIQNIAAVAEEQAASSKEVATAIDSATKSTMETVETLSNIRRATEETAHAAQGVAEQSQAMSEHSQTLIDVLSRFTLHTTPPASGKMALKAPQKTLA
ncbi:MAG: methyl-accepting chemotaxis protein [Synergistaceae bacterium]|jgi:methyl-accepting chemotaxis protein|nr:methyl-accepting chemotaxis protein [Synergistaceae bacterium]